MRFGKIVENNPVCPVCGGSTADVLKVIDADITLIDKEPLFEIIAKCRCCNTDFYYFLDLQMENRYSINKENHIEKQ